MANLYAILPIGVSFLKTDHIRKLRDEGNSLRKIVTLTGVSLSAVQKVCKQHEAKVS